MIEDDLDTAMRAVADLEAAADDPARVRAIARAQFAALFRLKQQRAQPQAAAPVPADTHSLVGPLASVSSAPDGQSIAVALGALVQITGAQRGFVAVRDATGAIRFPAARAFADLDVTAPEAQLSWSILRAAFDASEPLDLADARADKRFEHETSVQELALRAVLVVPLLANAAPFGVLYLDNPCGAFAAEARRAAEDFASIVGPILARDLVVERATARRADRLARLRAAKAFDAILGESEAITDLLDIVARVARTDAAALLLGESGSGKELVARALHAASRRASKPFVAVNCAALPNDLVEAELFGHERGAFTGAVAARDGRFAAAEGGTIFLDEVAELSPDAQAKILRVLSEGTFVRVGASQERKADVRVIAATHRDLAAQVATGRFREDLFYRLDVITLSVPPLRDREGDVAILARHFAARFAEEHAVPVRTFDTAALASLEAHPWPGNVRELRNVVERAVVLCAGDAITPAALPPTIVRRGPAPDAAGLKRAMREFKRRFVERAFAANDGDHDATARALGVHPKYLYKLIRDLDLDD